MLVFKQVYTSFVVVLKLISSFCPLLYLYVKYIVFWIHTYIFAYLNIKVSIQLLFVCDSRLFGITVFKVFCHFFSYVMLLQTANIYCFHFWRENIIDATENIIYDFQYNTISYLQYFVFIPLDNSFEFVSSCAI